MSINTASLKFKIQGMDCPGCARSIENAVAQLDSVEECELNFATETLTVMGKSAPSSTTTDDITDVVHKLGFAVADSTGPAENSMELPQNFWHYMWQRLETRLALWAALLALPGLIFTEILGREFIWVDGLSLIALLLAGWPIARSAWRSLTVGREININVLMTIAAIGAVIIGAYVEAAMVMVLFAIGEALEGYTASRARNAIRSLMQVAPNMATRLRKRDELVILGQDTNKQIKVEDLEIGDVILIRPGERIPMDGRVLAGHSAVNQAAITGESRLIEKTEDSQVFAGTINGEGALEVEVTHLAADNTISRMIRLVEEAQERRAPTQRFVDQFAKYYTPAVMVLALLVATLPPLLFGQPFFNPNPETFGWLYRGLALLVVACPCALVISTPVSVISAISNGARNGVLIKGGAYLEKLGQIKAIAFDKTGTLTLGQPSVVSVRAAACGEESHALPNGSGDDGRIDCAECKDVLALASAVEAHSEHPLAYAVVAASKQNGLTQQYPSVEDVSALVGRGVRGVVGDREIVIGSHSFFDEHVSHTSEQCHQSAFDAEQGYTPMMVGADNVYLGTITVADTIRQSSQSAVTELKQLGLRSIAMLTGDDEATAKKVGAAIGVTDIRAGLLPERKVAAIEELQAQHGALAMMGDGINDAPALATADVGIAVGGAGSTTQAMETADITLMHDDLRQLPFALRLSRATMRTIQANVVFSIGIKLIFLVLVLLGLGTMWMAVLADVGTSVLVTLNGMRLLRWSDGS
ncbi:heavy metal translocating P-type ATPase [Chloroflexi bacterium TSY]|nr:heavy metal translocating P-type ATPase [Chloroflexi bacterium TSY]